MTNDISLKHLENSRILITGGTGSLGKKLTQIILNKCSKTQIIIYSRDEFKQFQMEQTFTPEENKMLRFFLGDVRDAPRLKRAMERVNYVIHAAALKQVPAAEYNPEEFIKTNIGGAQNIIDGALENNIKAVVALSTDKAAAPINLYGATKLVSDKLFVAANNIKGNRDIKFSVVRYGNVMGSRGSVIPFFMKKAKSGILPITHKDMTRFNISLDEGAEMVFWALKNAIGGELFVPKIPSYKIETVTKAIAPEAKIIDVGIRPGEKLHEEMITTSDAINTIDIGKYYAILPSSVNKKKYLEHYNGEEVPEGFSFNSEKNDEWVTIEQMRELIVKYVDPDFKPILL